MNIFIKSLKEDKQIPCPFLGIKWNGEYENLKSILQQVAVVDKRVIPFKISVIGSDREIIFHNGVCHEDAPKEHTFFLFDNKRLIHSGSKLSELFNKALGQQ